MPVNRALVFTCALVYAAVTATAFSWEPCDVGQVPFVPDVVNLSPDPPIIGNDVSFAIQGKADRGVTTGTLDIIVYFMDTLIFQETDDLCGKTSCPIAPGVISIGYTQPLPPIAPPGDYTVQVVARDDTRAELMCVSVNFTLTMPSAANAAAVAPGAATVNRAAAVAQARSAFAELAVAAVTEAKQKQAVAASRRMAV